MSLGLLGIREEEDVEYDTPAPSLEHSPVGNDCYTCDIGFLKILFVVKESLIELGTVHHQCEIHM